MISVIVPSYNRESTIRRSVMSVLNQTYRDIELIVVDDGSQDKTLEILGEIDDARLRIIKHQTNRGACAARNTGIMNSRGDLIAFQDSDDFWRKNKLEEQVKVLNDYNADICFCKMERHNYPRKSAIYYPNLCQGVVEYKDLLSKSLVSTQTILAKREVFSETLFDENVKRRQDFDWIIRAAYGRSVCFDDSVLVDVYLQSDSITSCLDYKRTLDTFLGLWEKYDYLFEEYPEFKAGLLANIAEYKNRMGESAVDEYKTLYLNTGKSKYLIKYFLNVFNLSWVYTKF